MRKKELTPAQKYLLNAFKALTGEVTPELLAVLMERPQTLRSAVSAAFYKSVGANIDRYI